MLSAVKVYEVFCKVVGEEAARVLASYLEEVEKRKSVTGEELRETELRLRKEIERVRLEVERVKSSLTPPCSAISCLNPPLGVMG